jgi:hypothetical protein
MDQKEELRLFTLKSLIAFQALGMPSPGSNAQDNHRKESK